MPASPDLLPLPVESNAKPVPEMVLDPPVPGGEPSPITPWEPLDPPEARRPSRQELTALVAVVAVALSAGETLAVPETAKGAERRARTVRVPNVLGDSIAEAKQTLRRKRLRPGVVFTKAYKRSSRQERAEDFGARGVVKKVGTRVVHGEKVPKYSRTIKPGKSVLWGTTLYIKPGRIHAEAPVTIAPPTNTASPANTAPPANPGSSPAAPSPEAPPPSPEIDLQAETIKYLEANTIRLPMMSNCSAIKLRDNAGTTIGWKSADHCQRWDVTTDGSGNSTIAVDASTDLRPQEGPDANNLTSLPYETKAVIMPDTNVPANDAIDSFLGVLSNSTPEAVMAAYNEITMPESSTAGITPGQTIWMAGYPYLHRDSNGVPDGGVPQRELLETKAVGPEAISTSDGKSMRAYMTGLTDISSSGQACVEGMSGAAGVVSNVVTTASGSQKINYRYVGSLYGYDDFTPEGIFYKYPGFTNEQIREIRQQESGYDLRPLEAICHFSTRRLTPENSRVAKFVRSAGSRSQYSVPNLPRVVGTGKLRPPATQFTR